MTSLFEIFSPYDNYSSYINSDEWREKAARIRKRDGYRCQICGATDVPLEVHHLTYDRLYDENDSDLVTLCHQCHAKVTETWHTALDELKAKRRFQNMERRYKKALDLAHQLNVLMPYDISFGGEYVLTGMSNIKATCEKLNIEYKHAAIVNDVFAKIHVYDVIAKIGQGVPRWKLKQDGYPQSLITNAMLRFKKHHGDEVTIDDEFLCFIHEGKGRWTVSAIEDGLDTEFRLRFMPSIRYEDKWWDDE